MKLDDACFVDYGTRVVRKKDGGTIFPVYGGGEATFLMDIYNRENCLVVARFAMSQTCTRFVQGKFFLNDSGLTLRAKDKDLSQQFLDWIIISKNDLIFSFGKGSAQKNLDMEDFRNMEISFPVSLAEQQRIVDILDQEFAKIDALKANAEKSLQAAKDLFQATLKKELEPKEGWITKTLKEIAEDIGDGLHGTPEYEDNGPCYFINGNNLNDGTIVFSEKTKRVSNEERIKYYIPLNEQTLLVSINGTLGKVAYYRGENIILGKSACYIVLRSGISREYVFHYLASDIFMQYAEKEYTGLTIKNVSLKSMRNFPICFPTSITDQKKIVDVLNIFKKRCDTIKQNYQKTLTLCNDLKQALLRKAFNGEL